MHKDTESEKKKRLTCVVCRTFYTDKGQQAGNVWGVWGPYYQICKRCVRAGRDAKQAETDIRVRNWAEEHQIIV